MGDTLLRILPYLATAAAAAWGIYQHMQKRGDKRREENMHGIAQIEVARIQAQSEREGRLYQQQEELAQATIAEISRLRTLTLEIETRDAAQRALIEDLSRKLFAAERENARLKGGS